MPYSDRKECCHAILVIVIKHNCPLGLSPPQRFPMGRCKNPLGKVSAGALEIDFACTLFVQRTPPTVNLSEEPLRRREPLDSFVHEYWWQE